MAPDPLAERYAERIKLAAEQISDERAKAFRLLFSIAPWGNFQGGWDLPNIKVALAGSDDPETVGAIVFALEEEESDGK